MNSPLATLRSSHRFVLLFSAISALLLTACGTAAERKYESFSGRLGSCATVETLFLDDQKTQGAVSCTDHSFDAKAYDDPVSGLRRDMRTSCEAGGNTWRDTECPKAQVRCPVRVESLSRRAGVVNHRSTTSWKSSSGPALTLADNGRRLCAN